MQHHHPRAQLATHEVTNQAEPFGDVDLWGGDALLRASVEAAFAKAGVSNSAGAEQEAHLAAFAGEIGREAVRDLGRQANENPPKLKPFDRTGRRIDEVEFHPAYHALMTLGLGAGVSARAWTHPEGGHTTHSVLMMLMGWGDSGVCCPMSMTYAVVPALKKSEWAEAEWAPRVLTPAYDPRVAPAEGKMGATMGMAMTEKQGGSDVRANSTRAEPISPGSDEVRLTGHKWFCSAPMCDAFLTLAYEDEGLSCFLAPRWTPDDARNPMEIQRLKDKLGDRSNASSEIEYRGAWAKRVGEPGRGVRTIIEMVHHTRLDCLMGSAGGIRAAVAHAIRHCDGRRAFQKTLIDQPAMRGVLADLALEAEAAFALGFRVSAAFDAAAKGDEAEALFMRIATPIAKYHLCKRFPQVAYEAMECFGGVGYVEEGGMPRLYRQAPLNAIWEGSGNVIALDILRAIGREPAVFDALMAELNAARGHHPALDATIDRVGSALASGDFTEGRARGFAERAALALTAAELIRRGRDAAADAFIRLRIQEPHLHFGAGADADAVDQAALIDAARVAA